jgi:hypothetical protein
MSVVTVSQTGVGAAQVMPQTLVPPWQTLLTHVAPVFGQSEAVLHWTHVPVEVSQIVPVGLPVHCEFDVQPVEPAVQTPATQLKDAP